MKKVWGLLLVLVLLLCVSSAALAQDASVKLDPLSYLFPEGSQVSFGELRGTMQLYTAPAISSYRMYGGTAYVAIHRQVITVFAMSGDWVMVSRENADNIMNFGWANTTSLDYEVIRALPGKDPLNMAMLSATLKSDTPIWDYFDIYQAPMTTLTTDTDVLYLCHLYDELSGHLSYIQVSTQLGLMRGFVPYDTLEFE